MAEQPKDTKEKTTAITPMGNVKALLEASRGAISSRLPRHLTADRLLKVALTTINKNPTLLEATRESLIAAVMQAAELGLEPGGALGEGYLVVYNNKVKVNGVDAAEATVSFVVKGVPFKCREVYIGLGQAMVCFSVTAEDENWDAINKVFDAIVKSLKTGSSVPATGGVTG